MSLRARGISARSSGSAAESRASLVAVNWGSMVLRVRTWNVVALSLSVSCLPRRPAAASSEASLVHSSSSLLSCSAAAAMASKVLSQPMLLRVVKPSGTRRTHTSFSLPAMPRLAQRRKLDAAGGNTASTLWMDCRKSPTVRMPRCSRVFWHTLPMPPTSRTLSPSRKRTMPSRDAGTMNCPSGLFLLLAILASIKLFAMPAEAVRRVLS
mmetsp:Transcript_13530/g.45745  ORF Transcript_13530/g.45745 Transcript_13530/m.45745 type:complete len:210 (-) Transcript_13530:2-631(-)